MTTHMRYENLLIFCSVVLAVWFLVIYFWPRIFLNVYKRAILTKGFEGPIPINTLATEPQAIFADPLHPPASATKLATTGVNHDTLLTAGVLDLRYGPQVLHVPEMAGRYYSVQFTAPNNTIFAYVGKRTTGTQAGVYLITGPGWKGQVPSGMKQISSPNNSVFVIGRILVYSDSDLPTAYALTKQIQVVPLTIGNPTSNGMAPQHPFGPARPTVVSYWRHSTDRNPPPPAGLSQLALHCASSLPLRRSLIISVTDISCTHAQVHTDRSAYARDLPYPVGSPR